MRETEGHGPFGLGLPLRTALTTRLLFSLKCNVYNKGLPPFSFPTCTVQHKPLANVGQMLKSHPGALTTVNKEISFFIEIRCYRDRKPAKQVSRQGERGRGKEQVEGSKRGKTEKGREDRIMKNKSRTEKSREQRAGRQSRH